MLFCLSNSSFSTLSVYNPPHNTDLCTADGGLSLWFVIVFIQLSKVFCLSELLCILRNIQSQDCVLLCRGDPFSNKALKPEQQASTKSSTVPYTDGSITDYWMSLMKSGRKTSQRLQNVVSFLGFCGFKLFIVTLIPKWSSHWLHLAMWRQRSTITEIPWIMELTLLGIMAILCSLGT